MSKQRPPPKKKTEKQTQNANEAARMLRFEHTKGAEWILKRSANNASRGQNEFRGPGCLLLSRLVLTEGGGGGKEGGGSFTGSHASWEDNSSAAVAIWQHGVWHRSWLFEETELATCRIAARGETHTHLKSLYCCEKAFFNLHVNEFAPKRPTCTQTQLPQRRMSRNDESHGREELTSLSHMLTALIDQG